MIRKSPDDAKWQPWFYLGSALLALAVGLMATVLVASACDDGDPAEAAPGSTPTQTDSAETETATEQNSPDATSTQTATEAPATPTPAPTEEPTSNDGDGGDDGNGGGFEFVDNSPEVPCTIGAPLSQNTRVARDCVVGPLVNVEGFLLNDQAAAAYEDMKAAAAADGITLYLVSAYRDYDTQMQLYLAEVAAYGPDQNTSAKPGHSEHQLGTTVDLNDLSQSFGDSPEGLWLQQNAGSFGFQMSYPAGAEGSTGYAYEPWHWRFWGR